MEISRIGINTIPITYGANKGKNDTVFLDDLEGVDKQRIIEEAEKNEGKKKEVSLTELYFRMRWGLASEEEEKEEKQNACVQEADGQKAGKEQADLEAGKADKSQEGEEEEEEEESKTDTDIIVKPDGSRVLVVTTRIGDAETTMSLEISKPTDMPNEDMGRDAVESEGEPDSDAS